ncbi:Conserved_hypothetical protein [Hexamita inflata]|uniref:Transmembrane protein n=1 Tax=Hexamita inflata TaxID=28002 RepID=A0ABP1H6P6_9EUKA
MLLIYTSLQASASSFTECYSAKSYINGNSLTNQLNLHLIPFERLAQITEENLCQMYLPGKIVVAQIHYNDMSFPRAGQDEVYFIYKFNQEIIVTFQLDETDYRHIINKQNAMYELWYDVNLVRVNNSVNTIEHTKYNGTNCFQKVQLEYMIYEDIDINVKANNCAVKIDPALQVYLEFEVGLDKEQIPIYPCSSNCSQDEYSITSTQFNRISTYRIKKTSAIAVQLASFYSNFIQNRRLRITMNMTQTEQILSQQGHLIIFSLKIRIIARLTTHIQHCSQHLTQTVFKCSTETHSQISFCVTYQESQVYMSTCIYLMMQIRCTFKSRIISKSSMKTWVLRSKILMNPTRQETTTIQKSPRRQWWFHIWMLVDKQYTILLCITTHFMYLASTELFYIFTKQRLASITTSTTSQSVLPIW